MVNDEGATPISKRRLKLTIPKNITREHIIQAIEEIKIIGWPPRNNSTTYDLCYEEKRYPPKIVVMYANKYANGDLFDVSTFSGGEGTTNIFFKARGFQIVQKKKNNALVRESPPHNSPILKKYDEYNRRDVHDIFDKHAPFTPKSGIWGMRGIIPLPPNRNDFVFFVTLGRSDFIFKESITESGILTWQSEPKQKFRDPTIKKLIHHDHRKNIIHLFLRTDRNRNFSYLGRLAYITHDNEKEEPIFFKWQILDWDLNEKQAASMGLNLIPDSPTNEPASRLINTLIETPPPEQRFAPSLSGVKSREFIGRNVDFAEDSQKKTEIGKEGEKLVIEKEKADLIARGRPDFIQLIQHVSKIRGDGAGFDVESVEPNGTPKYIEVKTTVGGINTPFLLTINELNFSQKFAANYYLYRIYDFDRKTQSGKCFILRGDISNNIVMEPTQFNCRPQLKKPETNYSTINGS